MCFLLNVYVNYAKFSRIVRLKSNLKASVLKLLKAVKNLQFSYKNTMLYLYDTFNSIV